MERNWELYDTLLNALGGEELSLSICKALSMDEMNGTLEYIAQVWEIEGGDEE